MDAGNNDFSLHSDYSPGSTAGPATSISDIFGTILWSLRRGWLFPVFGCLIGLMLAVTYVLVTPTLYRSSARILLDRSVNRYLQANKFVDEPIFDDVEVASQIYILSSESIVVPVVRSMDLAHDSEFVGPPSGPINKLKKIVKQSIGWSDGANPTIDPDAAREQAAVEHFFGRLSIDRADVASVINVTFASEDPNKAARIANTVADTYITTTLEAKLNSTKIVSQWLQDRLVELKKQTMDADRALQDYKIANNLMNAGNGLPNYEQITTLNTQLTNARLAVAEAKARLDNIQLKPGESIMTALRTDILNNQTKNPSVAFALVNNDLARLRSEHRELALKVADMESRVGPEHVAVIKLQKQLDDLQKSIQAEERRVAESYADEYQMAKTRANELAAAMAQSVGQAATSSQAQVTMRELESSADTLRSLYNSFLQKFKEINTAQTETIPVQTARILTRATPANKSSKKAAAVLAGSIVFGLFLGAGAAVAREWVADVFRTPKAVEQATGIRSVILPMVKADGERTASSQGSTKSAPVEEFVLNAPYSRFTESLRNVKALINNAQLADGVKVIGVVSSVPKEGKTTIAANLAALMIASGVRTLLIDSDVHLRLLTAKLAPDAREGLIEALLDPSRLATLVSKREHSGLDVLPCVLSTRLPNAADLLGSPEMEQLLAAARKAYDYIIIEIAPIMSVVDIKMIERFIDRFIFVVEWGHTKRSLVLEALSQAPVIHERLIGIVLNKADPFSLRATEAYSGDYYHE
jgi:succinoglycan biosynthesis transport protein ExoP